MIRYAFHPIETKNKKNSIYHEIHLFDFAMVVICDYGLPADNLIQSISIVPCPESITPGTGYFTFSGKTDFTVENEEQAEVARCFSALFTQAAGFTPCVKVGEKKGKISFLTDDALKSEAYHLEITPRQIIVKALDTKGFFMPCRLFVSYCLLPLRAQRWWKLRIGACRL